MTRDDFPEHVRCFGQAVVQMRELRKISREELAKKSKVPLELLAKIEDGTATGADFGLKEICDIAVAMGITPYRLMQKYDQLIKDAGMAWWQGGSDDKK